MRSESAAEEKLFTNKAPPPISEVERRAIGAEYAPMTESLEQIVEEEFNPYPPTAQLNSVASFTTV